MRRIFGVSASVAIVALPSFLFRPAAFLLRRWRANAWCRFTFPPAVTLNRFAAPLCVFSFMWFGCSRTSARRRLRSKYCDQIRSFHLRPRFHSADLREFLDQTIEQGPADALVDD